MISTEQLVNAIQYRFNSDRLFNYIENRGNTASYILQYLNEVVLIFDTVTGLYVSWYNLTNIGRRLSTNIENYNMLTVFLDYLVEEMIDWGYTIK